MTTTEERGALDLEPTVATNDIALVDFWASWCGLCRQFAPVYEPAAEAHGDIVFGKIDTANHQARSTR